MRRKLIISRRNFSISANHFNQCFSKMWNQRCVYVNATSTYRFFKASEFYFRETLWKILSSALHIVKYRCVGKPSVLYLSIQILANLQIYIVYPRILQIEQVCEIFILQITKLWNRQTSWGKDFIKKKKCHVRNHYIFFTLIYLCTHFHKFLLFYKLCICKIAKEIIRFGTEKAERRCISAIQWR